MDDHGSDRYDYVELIDAGGRVPSGEWFESLLNEACLDCRANVFLTYVGGEPEVRSSWRVTIAHDETCPAMTRIERNR